MIDYELIAKAIKYYRETGYAYVDLPWIVPEEYVNITLPRGNAPQRVDASEGEALVGSAEQSFLQYIDIHDIKTPDLHLMSVTPCFRDEYDIDEYTRPYFMKLELCVVNPTNTQETILKVKQHAEQFLTSLGLRIFKVELEDSIDLVVNIQEREIELGSYGYRRHYGLRWVYGTGLAEPRTSLCINLKQ